MAAAEGEPHLQQKASLTQRVVDKVLPKLHDEDVYDVSGLLALHSISTASATCSRASSLCRSPTHSTRSAT